MRMTTLAALALGWCLAAHGAAAQETDQAAIARELLSKDHDRVSDALGRLPRIVSFSGTLDRYPEGFEPTAGLVEALVAAYEHEVMLDEPKGDGELFIGLLEHIIATKHPLTIDVLTRSLWGSYPAVEALLHFGPSVLPGVVELAMSPEATPYQADGAMFALGKAVERWDQELGPEIREAMREAAILHLEGAFASFEAYLRGYLFDEAVVLAEALRDPELTAIARDARHPSTGEPGIPDRARKLAQEREEAKAVREMLRKADQRRSPPRR